MNKGKGEDPGKFGKGNGNGKGFGKHEGTGCGVVQNVSRPSGYGSGYGDGQGYWQNRWGTRTNGGQQAWSNGTLPCVGDAQYDPWGYHTGQPREQSGQ